MVVATLLLEHAIITKEAASRGLHAALYLVYAVTTGHKCSSQGPDVYLDPTSTALAYFSVECRCNLKGHLSCGDEAVAIFVEHLEGLAELLL